MAARWLLPDDGIIDPVAVAIAAAGTRRVRMTLPERRAAAALIIARGGTRHQVAKRLFVGWSTAAALVASLPADLPELREAA